MATNSGGTVAVADSHGSARGRASPELKNTVDLPIGSSSPKERKRKRKAEESDAEDSRGAAEPADREGSEGEGVGKKERKRNKKKRKEREPDSDEEKENEKGPEKKNKREKSERRSKGRSSPPPLKEDVDALSDRASPSAPPSPPESNSTTATISSGSKNPSKSSIRNNINTEERRLLRKSVSFTPDTKATDGDSIKTLYENHDPFAHYASYQQHINDYPTNELPEGFDDEPKPKKPEPKGDHKRFDDSEPAPIPELSQKKRKMREKREKRQKKKEAKEDAEDEANGSEGGAKLSYLLTYHTSRDTWRFEKGKQNWILRHAFNLSKIPEEGYAAALKSYVTGLQSPAARDRLLAEANEIVKRGKDTISKDGEKLDPEDQKTSVTRAKLVLSALGHEDDEGDDEEEEDSSDMEE